MKEITVTNFEEYEDPILYDKENDSYTNDIPFLLKWASKMEGVIIEIACGTGRTAIPLARNGHKVIGVDIHRGMLQEARRKSAKLDLKIEWIEQDCTLLNLPVKSRFVYSVGNSFQHFLTNEAQDGLLQSVSKHMEPGGLFIFNTRFPSSEELLSPSIEEYWRSYKDNNRSVDVFVLSKYDSLNQLQYNTTIRRYKNQDGKVIDEKRTNIILRYVFPKEMERMLLVNGFDVLHVYEDWKGNPVTEDSVQLIYVCRKVK